MAFESYRDFVRGLVEEPDENKRMEMSVENMEVFEPQSNDDQAKEVERLKQELAAKDTTIAEREAVIAQKDKEFKDRFFGPKDNNTPQGNKDDGSMIPDEKPSESEHITLQDLGF